MFDKSDFPILGTSEDTWYVTRKDPRTGKYHAVIKTGFNTIKEAEVERDAMLAEMNGEAENN